MDDDQLNPKTCVDIHLEWQIYIQCTTANRSAEQTWLRLDVESFEQMRLCKSEATGIAYNIRGMTMSIEYARKAEEREASAG
jgi:hypothetical protein